jgi:hypothetical protein
MTSIIYAEGTRFNRLTIVSRAENKHNKTRWNCVCDCGKHTEQFGQDLRRGKAKSCGCLKNESARDRLLTHGKTGSKIYYLWAGMIQRCTNQNYKQFQDYGGRGITVCERWKSFDNFLSDMGAPPLGLTLERKNNSLGYYPDNCIWATRQSQGANKRNNKHISSNGVTKTQAEWSRTLGISQQSIYKKLKSGVTIEKIIEKYAK